MDDEDLTKKSLSYKEIMDKMEKRATYDEIKEDYKRWCETSPFFKRKTEEYKRLLNIIFKAIEECNKYYPKDRYRKRIWFLYNIFFRMNYLEENYDEDKYMDYIENFSNYIAKKYFPDEISGKWRRPIALEIEIWKYYFWVLKNHKVDIFKFLNPTKIQSEIHFGEKWCTTEQLSQFIGISVEELEEFAKKHEKGILKGYVLKVKKNKDKTSFILDGEDLKLNKE